MHHQAFPVIQPLDFWRMNLLTREAQYYFQKLLKLLEQKKYWLTAAIMMRLKTFLECVYRTEEEAKATGRHKVHKSIPATLMQVLQL